MDFAFNDNLDAPVAAEEETVMGKVIPLSSAVQTVHLLRPRAATIVCTETVVPRDSSPRFKETVINLWLSGAERPVQVHIPRGVCAIDLHEHFQLLTDDFFYIHDEPARARKSRLVLRMRP